MRRPPVVSEGKVYLVGAGPGDPGLLTLRGRECIARSDVIFYDYLVNPAVLEHASGNAQLTPLGAPGTGRVQTPDEIMDLVVEAAQGGRIVTRLKGGDPSVFGRLGDEIDALRTAGIPFEIVPGITAGLAIGAYCEIPLTHQDDASAMAVVTGRERNAKNESGLDYDSLARFRGTLVFYMGVGRSRVWSAELMERGRSPDTPVAIVRWCSRASQSVVRCTLGTVAQVVDRNGLRPPAVFVVGDVVSRAPELSWFAARPLFGTRVLVPGSAQTSRKLRDQLSEEGAEVLCSPVIQITEPDDWAPVDQALDRIEHYDWLVFSSANGVGAFMGRLASRGGDARMLGRVRLAAMGSGTAAKLAEFGVRADLVPEVFVAEALAAALLKERQRRKVLLVRASRGRRVLAEELSSGGTDVDEVIAYASTDVAEPDPRVTEALVAGEVDWITMTSESTARALVRLYGAKLAGARFASIGPITSAALRELGYEPSVEASPQTTSGLVASILGW